jgi:hypothetical protein
MKRAPIGVRRFLRLERTVLAFRPTPTPPPSPAPKPPRADEVLAAVARAFEPGDRVSRRAVAEAAGVTLPAAGAVRRWAMGAGQWPYLHPLTGFRTGRQKGGR